MPTQPLVVGSCRYCRGYGWLIYRWCCGGCAAWNLGHPQGRCAGCSEEDMGLSKAHCRRCWKEAARRAGPWNTKVLLHEDTVFPQHQLALIWVAARTPGKQARPPRPSQAATSAGADIVVPGDGQL